MEWLAQSHSVKVAERGFESWTCGGQAAWLPRTSHNHTQTPLSLTTAATTTPLTPACHLQTLRSIKLNRSYGYIIKYGIPLKGLKKNLLLVK